MTIFDKLGLFQSHCNDFIELSILTLNTSYNDSAKLTAEIYAKLDECIKGVITLVRYTAKVTLLCNGQQVF